MHDLHRFHHFHNLSVVHQKLLIDPSRWPTVLFRKIFWRSIKVKNQINIVPYSECPEGEWEWWMQKVFGQDEAGDDPFSHLRIFIQSLLVPFGTWPLRALLYRKPTFLPSPPKCVFEWFIIWSPKSLFFCPPPYTLTPQDFWDPTLHILLVVIY